MEGMFLESVPVMGSLIAGILLLATVVAAVVYGWVHEDRSRRRTAEGQTLKKAA